MATARTGTRVTSYTPQDVTMWLQSQDRQVFLGDVAGADGGAMGVGFARYGPGASNDWVVTYDEVLVVTSGTFSVTSADGRRTAQAGELLYLRAGTTLTYAAGEEGAEVVYVTHPHPASTGLREAHPELVATFHPIEGAPDRFADGKAVEHIELLRRIYDPHERGESADLTSFFDALTDDVVLELAAGVVRGKTAVAKYFEEGSKRMEFRPFERPLQYYGAGDRVVQQGFETFRVKASGVTHRADWAWVYDFRDGRISWIVGIEDLSGIIDVVAEAIAAAETATDGGADAA